MGSEEILDMPSGHNPPFMVTGSWDLHVPAIVE